MDLRDSFIFYRSFFEAISELDKETQAEVMTALCDYALNDVEPKAGGLASTMFKLMKPQIDANNKRFKNGSKGGRPKTKDEPSDNQTITKSKPNHNQDVTKSKPNHNQDVTEPEPNVNVNDNDNVNDNENVNKNENVNENEKVKPFTRAGAQGGTASEIVQAHGFAPKTEKAVLEWIKYKIEKKQGYKETGLKSLLKVVQRQIDLYGDDPVIQCIEDSMAAGWQGICWDKMKAKPKSRYEEITDWFREDAK